MADDDKNQTPDKDRAPTANNSKPSNVLSFKRGADARIESVGTGEELTDLIFRLIQESAPHKSQEGRYNPHRRYPHIDAWPTEGNGGSSPAREAGFNLGVDAFRGPPRYLFEDERPPAQPYPRLHGSFPKDQDAITDRVAGTPGLTGEFLRAMKKIYKYSQRSEVTTEYNYDSGVMRYLVSRQGNRYHANLTNAFGRENVSLTVARASNPFEVVTADAFSAAMLTTILERELPQPRTPDVVEALAKFKTKAIELGANNVETWSLRDNKPEVGL